MSEILVMESKDWMDKTKEQKELTKKENDLKLREAILVAAENKGIEATPSLIAQAKMRFAYEDGQITKQSIYNDIDDFMNRHSHNAPKIKSVTEMIDERAVKKQLLYDELVKYAETGNMKAYRACRKEYDKL